MRNQWYGDNRDLVKWSAAYTLIEGGARSLLYVPMLTPDEPPLQQHRLSTGECLAPSVVAHFRDYEDFARIPWPEGARVDWIPGLMGDRAVYFGRVAEKLRQLRAEAARPVLLLVDPDTGIEPISGGSRKHVLRSELASLYSALGRSDVLAVYQHAPRQFDPNWIDEKRVLMAHALSVNPVLIRPLSCLDVARDVVLLTVEGAE